MLYMFLAMVGQRPLGKYMIDAIYHQQPAKLITTSIIIIIIITTSIIIIIITITTQFQEFITQAALWACIPKALLYTSTSQRERYCCWRSRMVTYLPTRSCWHMAWITEGGVRLGSLSSWHRAIALTSASEVGAVSPTRISHMRRQPAANLRTDGMGWFVSILYVLYYAPIRTASPVIPCQPAGQLPVAVGCA